MKLKAENPEHKSGKRNIWLIIIFSFLLIITGLFFYNRDFLDIYYLNFKINHFKTNDKLYAEEYLINGDSDTSKASNIFLFRKVKPLKSNPSGRPSMAMSAWSISGDSLRKYRTANIGTYTGFEIMGIANRDNEYHPMLFFSVTTNKKALIKNYLTDPPAGYEFDEGPFYVWGHLMTDQELHTFKK